MHIVFANRYYAPDMAATSQIVSDLAAQLAASGYTVEVITSRQRYDDPLAGLPSRETLDGVRVHRIWTSTFGRANLAGRAVDYLSFYLSFFFTCLRTLKRDSVLVCCTDPPLLSIPAALACFLTRARLVNWLQDIYPEVAVALGIASASSPLTRALVWLRNHSLRRAHRNVVLGEVMAAKVQSAAVDPRRVSIIHNWSLTPPGEPAPGGAANPLRRSWGIADSFVIGYSGNLGRAHEIETLLQAAQILRQQHNVRFLVIGGGHYTRTLQSRAADVQLDNIVFQPYQPLEKLALSLAAADVHLVILRPEMEGCIVPSKFYGAAASGRPVIFLGSLDGELARILARADAGISIATGDGPGLAASIGQLREDPDACQRLGSNARRLCTTTYTRENALRQWLSMLEELGR
ncbi:MAG: glycosyltransferase family 4 protein [Halioglobus sp.]|nr:glycosyltransferase family 4 protein [Halioglobus sp.]